MIDLECKRWGYFFLLKIWHFWQIVEILNCAYFTNWKKKGLSRLQCPKWRDSNYADTKYSESIKQLNILAQYVV